MTEAEITEHLEALHNIERLYGDYVGAWQAGIAGSMQSLRSNLLRRAGRGQRAMAASGVRFAITPAPMFGGPVLRSLPEQLFAFERPAYGPTAVQLVFDAIATAVGLLEDQLETLQRGGPPSGPDERPERRLTWPRLTLFGRIHKLPGVVAFVADIGTAGAVIVAVLKFLGVF